MYNIVTNLGTQPTNGQILQFDSTTKLWNFVTLGNATVTAANNGLSLSGTTAQLGHAASGSGLSDFTANRYLYTGAFDLETRGTGGFTYFDGSVGALAINTTNTRSTGLIVGDRSPAAFFGTYAGEFKGNLMIHADADPNIIMSNNTGAIGEKYWVANITPSQGFRIRPLTDSGTTGINNVTSDRTNFYLTKDMKLIHNDIYSASYGSIHLRSRGSTDATIALEVLNDVGINLLALDDIGTFKLNRYGLGNKEAADLTKTSSGYGAVFATDGTIIEELQSFQPNTQVTYGTGTTTPSTSSANFTYDGVLNLQATIGDKLRIFDGGAGVRYGFGINGDNFNTYMPTGAAFTVNYGGDFQAEGAGELFKIETGGGVANVERWIAFSEYGQSNKSATDLTKTDSGLLAGFATDGTVIEQEVASIALGGRDQVLTAARSVTGAFDLDFTGIGNFDVDNTGRVRFTTDDNFEIIANNNVAYFGDQDNSAAATDIVHGFTTGGGVGRFGIQKDGKLIANEYNDTTHNAAGNNPYVLTINQTDGSIEKSDPRVKTSASISITANVNNWDLSALLFGTTGATRAEVIFVNANGATVTQDVTGINTTGMTTGFTFTIINDSGSDNVRFMDQDAASLAANRLNTGGGNVTLGNYGSITFMFIAGEGLVMTQLNTN